jgi:hypothetical protein
VVGTFFLFNCAKEKRQQKEGIGDRTLLNSKFPQSYLRKIRLKAVKLERASFCSDRPK